MTDDARDALATPAPETVDAPRHPGLERRLRIAGSLVVLGMLVEGATLLALDRPAGFLAFAGVAVAITLVGVLYYLWSLVR